MARIIFVIFLANLALFAPAYAAQNYEPGTIGYFYNDCKKALAESSTLTALQETPCGAFAEGYLTGAMISNGVVLTESPDDPCAAELKTEYDRINARICKNLPVFDLQKTDAGTMLKTAIEIVTRWIEFEDRSAKKDPLMRSATKELATVMSPGNFCDDLKSSYARQTQPFQINPALLKFSVKDFLSARENIKLSAKFEQCKKDLTASKGSSVEFVASRCGSEISGFIAGLHTTAYLQKDRATPSEACKKPIDRLYKTLNSAETMCVNFDTNPLWVADVFVKNYKPVHGNTAAFGGIGYQAIYKGFICAEERKPAATLTPMP